MQIADPHVAPNPLYVRRFKPWLADERDAELLDVAVQSFFLSICGVSLFFAGRWLWYAAPLYLALLFAGLLDRFTLMLHCTSHRPLFKPKYRVLNWIIPCLLGPFFGQTPHTYFAHHLGMHHPEENLAGDLSSTMGYRRDSLRAWLRYCGRFLVFGVFELAQYMTRHRRRRLLHRIVAGELVYWTLASVLLYLRPAATLVVLLIPLLAIRTLMMMGNWAQHAFIAPERPNSAYGASITCINSRYNRRCFNDGYHIGHHLHPRAHWTEYPSQLEQNLEEYGRQDAVLFDGLDFFQVWLLLMTGRWSRLARAFVQLPGARIRCEADVVRFLQQRVQPLLQSVRPPSEPSGVATTCRGAADVRADDAASRPELAASTL